MFFSYSLACFVANIRITPNNNRLRIIIFTDLRIICTLIISNKVYFDVFYLYINKCLLEYLTKILNNKNIKFLNIYYILN